MDFTLPESARIVQSAVGEIAAKYDPGYWASCEREVRFPEELWA